MTETEKKKRAFRASKKWKSFRHEKVVECGGKDVITGNKLRKGFELHHMDLDDSRYENLDNAENFVPINSMTHKCVHWLYRYYKNDKSVLGRLADILERMTEINK